MVKLEKHFSLQMEIPEFFAQQELMAIASLYLDGQLYTGVISLISSQEKCPYLFIWQKPWYNFIRYCTILMNVRLRRTKTDLAAKNFH